MLHLHPIKFMLCAGTTALSLGIYTFAVCERVSDAAANYGDGFGDSTYVLLVTITGVGYGDITPQTVCGRMVSVTLAISFVMFTAVLVAVINTKIRLTTEELRFFRFFQKRSKCSEPLFCPVLCRRAAYLPYSAL